MLQVRDVPLLFAVAVCREMRKLSSIAVGRTSFEHLLATMCQQQHGSFPSAASSASFEFVFTRQVISILLQAMQQENSSSQTCCQSMSTQAPRDILRLFAVCLFPVMSILAASREDLSRVLTFLFDEQCVQTQGLGGGGLSISLLAASSIFTNIKASGSSSSFSSGSSSAHDMATHALSPCLFQAKRELVSKCSGHDVNKAQVFDDALAAELAQMHVPFAVAGELIKEALELI